MGQVGWTHDLDRWSRTESGAVAVRLPGTLTPFKFWRRYSRTGVPRVCVLSIICIRYMQPGGPWQLLNNGSKEIFAILWDSCAVLKITA